MTLSKYGTAYVPANDTTVTLYECNSCGYIYSQKDTHDKYSLPHVASK